MEPFLYEELVIGVLPIPLPDPPPREPVQGQNSFIGSVTEWEMHTQIGHLTP